MVFQMMKLVFRGLVSSGVEPACPAGGLGLCREEEPTEGSKVVEEDIRRDALVDDG